MEMGEEAGGGGGGGGEKKGVRIFEVHCCLAFTETVRTIRDREPRTSTSTFTQLLSSVR